MPQECEQGNILRFAVAAGLRGDSLMRYRISITSPFGNEEWSQHHCSDIASLLLERDESNALVTLIDAEFVGPRRKLSVDGMPLRIRVRAEKAG
jgi:hypothetical protein